jgi:hypothetical protein
MYVDPIEETDRYKKVVARAERLARLLADTEIIARGGKPGMMGYSHLFDSHKKYVLRECFDIQWRDQAEMNPHIQFD